MHDIIGDIHGQSDKLKALLNELGYREHQGAWRHPSRIAVFVGDYIDRGPGQLETLRIVRSMMDAGSAIGVMGNHEFNAMAWATEDPLAPGVYLRKHSDGNRNQHAAFLAELEGKPALHKEWLTWFLELPLWLELPKFRVIHACWHPQHMAALAPRLRFGNRMDEALVEAASRKKSPEFIGVETLIKGLEVDLPGSHRFTDKEGTVRRKVRVRWWDTEATTFRRAAIMNDTDSNTLPDTSIPPLARLGYTDQKPVFFGHYWKTGSLGILAPNACCVDYSAARASEPLVAYRHHGENELTNDHLVAVGASRDVARRPAP